MKILLSVSVSLVLGTCICLSAPVQQYKGVDRYELLQGNWHRWTDFVTWPGGTNLFLKHEHVYRFYPGPVSPSTCDIQGDYAWYHINPDGNMVVDWTIHFRAYPGMPPGQPYITSGVNLGYALPWRPRWHMINRFSTYPGISEDEYCLSGFTLTNGTGVPQLFTLNYNWDRDFPNPDVACWTRYVVQPYAIKQVVPSMQDCLLQGLDSVFTASGKVLFMPPSMIPRSQDPLAVADNCTGANLNPPAIPSLSDILYHLSPSGGIYNPWPVPP